MYRVYRVTYSRLGSAARQNKALTRRVTRPRPLPSLSFFLSVLLPATLSFTSTRTRGFFPICKFCAIYKTMRNVDLLLIVMYSWLASRLTHEGRRKYQTDRTTQHRNDAAPPAVYAQSRRVASNKETPLSPRLFHNDAELRFAFSSLVDTDEWVTLGLLRHSRVYRISRGLVGQWPRMRRSRIYN